MGSMAYRAMKRETKNAIGRLADSRVTHHVLRLTFIENETGRTLTSGPSKL
jgi:hypothetical protein